MILRDRYHCIKDSNSYWIHWKANVISFMVKYKYGCEDIVTGSDEALKKICSK